MVYNYVPFNLLLYINCIYKGALFPSIDNIYIMNTLLYLLIKRINNTIINLFRIIIIILILKKSRI